MSKTEKWRIEYMGIYNIWYIKSDIHRNYAALYYIIKKNGVVTFVGYGLPKDGVYER